MLSDEVTTGAIKATDSQKRHYAQKSHAWNIAQARFREAFPEVGF
jgi:ubiquitin-conjugating enzyme E2 J2